MVLKGLALISESSDLLFFASIVTDNDTNVGGLLFTSSSLPISSLRLRT